MNDDDLNLIDDLAPATASKKPWKVLIVDDEEEVHTITKVALSDFHFGHRPLEFLHAYSGQEAREMVDSTTDIAIMLVDVVMETDRAGLDFVHYVRETAKLKFPRIILRTGQPGQAPERTVITEYDINDYKQKTELTQEKMFSVMHTSLGSYRDLMALEHSRKGLRKVIEASAQLFELQSMERFAQGVLEQLAALLYLNDEALVIRCEGVAAEEQDGDMSILAGTGRFADLAGKKAREVLPPDVLALLLGTMEKGTWIQGDGYFTAAYTTDSQFRNILYVSGDLNFEPPEMDLIQLFCQCVSKAQDNLHRINEKLAATHGAH